MENGRKIKSSHINNTKAFVCRKKQKVENEKTKTKLEKKENTTEIQ